MSLDPAWTPHLLKIHFDELREADDKRYEQRSADQEKAVNTALAAAKTAVDAALSAAALAVDKAERNTKDWQVAANEWRGAMSDRERQFVTRRELYAYIGLAVAIASAISRYIIA